MIIFGIIFTLIMFLLLECLLLIPFGAFWSAYFFFGLLAIILICGVFYFINKKRKNYSKLASVMGVCIISYLVLALIILFVNSPMIRAEKYRSLLPAPVEKEFLKEVAPFDVTKAPIVTQSTAKQVADRTISQDGTIGSRAEINSITLQNVNGKLYYVLPLEHSGFFAWLNNRNEGTPFIMVNANNKECELVKCHIRYQPSAFYSQDLARKLFSTNMTYGYTDFTFEIDDNKHPYWTASVYKNTIGFSGAVITGTAVVDAETGDIKIYSIKDTPKWVDRIQPENLVVRNINLRGKYIHGFSPFNNNGKIMTTEGAGIVYNNDKCYYYTGITSVGKDESSLGFYLVDTRTMESTYFRLSGATETAAIKSAEGKVQNLGYTGAFPILLNVENKATYFIPLQDKNALTKMYAMVSVEDHTILGTGETVEECKEAYLKALFSKNQLENTSGTQSEITGAVKRIGAYTIDGNNYYIIVLENSEGLYTIPLSESVKLPITKEGDTVTIKYVDSGTVHSFTAITFDNLSIK